MESGDVCEECGRGLMRVGNVKYSSDKRWRTQYLVCRECKGRGKCVFRIDEWGQRIYGDDPAELKAIIERQARLIERLIGNQGVPFS